jgi:hypothetical protein
LTPARHLLLTIFVAEHAGAVRHLSQPQLWLLLCRWAESRAAADEPFRRLWLLARQEDAEELTQRGWRLSFFPAGRLVESWWRPAEGESAPGAEVCGHRWN